jgi:flagellar basal-body rod protein FlgG
LTATDNTFDMAIQGKGYFQVTLPTGETSYTRDGTFQLDGTGQLVTHDGYSVQPGITIPATAIDITINGSGQVQAKMQGQAALQTVGQLTVSTFPNEAGLESIGNNLYLETPASGSATSAAPGSTGFGAILQGFLETSNVNAVEEISNLISAQRAYEMNSKVIKTSDEMLGTLAQLR